MFTQYLKPTEIIDFLHPSVEKLSKELAKGTKEPVEIAKRCFEWVRDEVRHSYDYKLNHVTCKASEVLEFRTGYCYAKSHLLAGLLRANSIPAGFCYQRLSIDEMENKFCLHGLNAIYLPDVGWYRIDARGNKEGVSVNFNPPLGSMAFEPKVNGEINLPEIWPDPLPVVIKVLTQYNNYEDVNENLPDIQVIT